MTADTFREIALTFDGAVEASHMGHPDFRANGRIFATLHGDDLHGMVKVTPGQQAELIREHPRTFTPSSGAWGRQGCTNVALAAASAPAVRGAMLLAWQAAMDRPPAKRRAAAARGGRVRR